jgi:hypothetical protein
MIVRIDTIASHCSHDGGHRGTGGGDGMDIVQGRLGLRRIQGSVMTWRLERYSVCMCGCML